MELKDSRLFYIGGVVRDEILGRESFDVDITFVGNAIEYAKTLPYEILRVNEKFGTVRIDIDGTEVDLASTRDETYPKKGHLPQVYNIGCSLEVDVKRRDFTINTLAKNLVTGEIVDYLGGIKDIENKTLRILHDNSFIDDPTRIIRGLKFAVRFGFELDKRTKELQEEYLENVNYDMSRSRLKNELVETFDLNCQEAYDKFFDEKMYRLLTDKEISKSSVNIEKLVDDYKPKTVWIVYMGTISPLPLPLSKLEQKIVEDYESIKGIIPKTDFEIYKLFEGLKLETVLLYAVGVDENIARKYLDEISKITIKTTGVHLKRLGIKPSKKYKECFEFILRRKIENPDAKENELVKEFFGINS